EQFIDVRGDCEFVIFRSHEGVSPSDAEVHGQEGPGVGGIGVRQLAADVGEADAPCISVISVDMVGVSLGIEADIPRHGGCGFLQLSVVGTVSELAADIPARYGESKEVAEFAAVGEVYGIFPGFVLLEDGSVIVAEGYVS